MTSLALLSPSSADFIDFRHVDDATCLERTGAQGEPADLAALAETRLNELAGDVSCGDPDGYRRNGVQNTLTVGRAMKPATTKALTPDRADFVALRRAHEKAFVERVIANLKEDREEARSEGEAVATDAAENACVKVAQTIAPCLPPFVQYLRWAAAAGESGVVSLVLQSSASNRRLTYEFSPDGKEVFVIEIDEHLGHKLTSVGIEDAQFLRERAGWVARRA